MYLDVSEDTSLKEKILRAITRKLKVEEGFNHGQLAAKCPPHTTGADLYALCSAATINALRREIDILEDKGAADAHGYIELSMLAYQKRMFVSWLKLHDPTRWVYLAIVGVP